MLIDPRQATSVSGGSVVVGDKGDSNRWLAELEREFLTANAPILESRGDAAPARSKTDTFASAGETGSRQDPGTPGAPEGEPALSFSKNARPCRRESAPQEISNAVLQREAATDHSRANVAKPGTLPATAALSLCKSEAEVRALASGSPLPSSLADSTPSMADCPVDAVDVPAMTPAFTRTSPAGWQHLGERGETLPELGGGSSAALEPAPRYARQLMTLTSDELGVATIRDANIGSDGSWAVACSVSLQLRASGFAVQRVFVNGQRFDNTPTGVSTASKRIHDPFQDDLA
jgi:hypothetical protein